MPNAETLRIIVIQEGDMLVAQCLEHDICTQAASVDQLKERLAGQIELERHISHQRTGEDFGGIPPAPSFFHDMWEHGSALDNGAPYDLRMAA